MKARIIETGEEITIDGSAMSIFDIKGRCYYLSELTFIKDETDWEQRRYEVAKANLSALLSSPTYDVQENLHTPMYRIEPILSEKAISYADALIKELKK